ncbi:hypothetical protein AVEN_82208-1, partial [Araneus ventricosus]
MEHRVVFHSERQKRVKLEFQHELTTVLGKRKVNERFQKLHSLIY